MKQRIITITVESPDRLNHEPVTDERIKKAVEAAIGGSALLRLVPGSLIIGDGWRTMDSAPKGIEYRSDRHEYGPYILAYPCFGEVARVRWWQAADGDRKARNFLEDGGNAVHPTHWQPLPAPPVEAKGERNE